MVLTPPSTVNDVQSQLNPTNVSQVVAVDSVESVQAAIRKAERDRLTLAVSGGRHAMGGQQFADSAVLLDMRGLNRIINLDSETGVLEVEAGIQWPDLIGQLVRMQADRERQWGIAQKQTGADRLSLGGALAANGHGRGLTMKPLVSDIESFRLVNAGGDLVDCSRDTNSELFSLVAGGYGLFGVVTSMKLRLSARQELERVVEIIKVDDLMPAFDQRIRDGFIYGDCQFSLDDRSPDFLRKGVFSCYRPVDPATPVPEDQRQLDEEHWMRLVSLAHTDKAAAFEEYSRFYLETSGQIYWSDVHQLSVYLDDYHERLDARMPGVERATEVITEIYVPRSDLADFMVEVAEDFRRNQVNVIYGTIRLIERDTESFLAWAREPYACMIFNLHTVHTPQGIEHSAEAFRRLIDMAIRRGGSYFLTYHRFATRAQVETCYPRLQEFLGLKKKHDPHERFQSDWYRHYREMFTER
jgi:FAD/FMN-containing dehydrogenase